MAAFSSNTRALRIVNVKFLQYYETHWDKIKSKQLNFVPAFLAEIYPL